VMNDRPERPLAPPTTPPPPSGRSPNDELRPIRLKCLELALSLRSSLDPAARAVDEAIGNARRFEAYVLADSKQNST
jgi:hypothetical protein